VNPRRAWILYDWANSAFVTTVVTAVYPVYFQEVAAAGLPRVRTTTIYAGATTVALVLVAVLGPILGSIADERAAKKRLLAACTVLGVLSSFGLAAVGKGDWRLGVVLFITGNVGWAGSLVFYDALLPHLARGKEADRLSAAGYAFGYLGGGLLLACNLLTIQRPQLFGLADAAAASRLSFAAVGAWWLLFSLPLFRWVPEPPARPAEGPARDPFARLASTLRDLRAYRQAFLLLIAILLFTDGVSTIIRMATIYGAEVGVSRGALIGAVLLVQFLGIPFAFLFGRLAGKLGARGGIFLGIAIYSVASLCGFFLETERGFYLLAVLVAIAQGGTQALSRSLFASVVPVERSAEFFGFFALADKFAGILGPALFGLTVALAGSTRWAVLSVLFFFLAGAWLLARVDVERGRREAATGPG
jgi:UMF1 family MFS transporter